MKCKYCGAEVGLEENFCSYCGKPNEQALRHTQDMASYHRRYAATEAAVINKTKRFSQIILRAVLILIILIATIVMYVVTENAYSIPETMRRREAEKNPERTIAALDGYLEKRDYLGFSTYMEYNGIRTFRTDFEAYSCVSICADYYKDFVLRMERLFLHTDQEDWLKYSASSDIRWLCQSLDEFLYEYDRAQQREESERFLSFIEDMRQTMTGMLRVYLGIGEEEFEEFLALSENRKAAYVEEVLLRAQESN